MTKNQLTWVLVVAFVVWSAICAFLVVSAYDPVEAADDGGEAMAQTAWFLIVGMAWLGVSLPILALLVRRVRSK